MAFESGSEMVKLGVSGYSTKDAHASKSGGLTGKLVGLFVLLLGFAATFLLALLFAAGDIQSGRLFEFGHVFYVVPLGAGFIGLIIGYVYRLLVWMLERRPFGGEIIGLVLSSALFFAFQAISYYRLIGDLSGIEIIPERLTELQALTGSFFIFVDAAVTSVPIMLQGPPNPAQLGDIAYLVLFWNFLGMVFGAFFAFGSRPEQQYCHSCDRYMSRTARLVRFCGDADIARPILSDLQSLLQDQHLAQAVLKAESLDWSSQMPKGRSLGFELTYFKCADCDKASAHLTPRRHNVDELGFEIGDPKPLNLDQYWG